MMSTSVQKPTLSADDDIILNEEEIGNLFEDISLRDKGNDELLQPHLGAL